MRRAALLLLLAAAPAAPSWAGEPTVLALRENGGLAFIDCAFDGFAQDCLWDSGSARTNAPNVPPLSGYPLAGVDGKRDLVKFASLRFGAAELGPAAVWRGGMGFPSLGADLSTNRRFQVTPTPSPSLILEPAATVEAPAQVLYRDGQNRIVVEIGLGSRRVRAMWDTGTANTRVARSALRLAPEDFAKTGEYSSRKESGSRYRLATLSVGAARLKDVEVLDSDFDRGKVVVILGWDVIRRLDWRFDPERRQWSAREPSPAD